MSTRIDIATKNDGKWVRPAEWLPIDSLVSAGQHKFVGLCAVIDGQVSELRVRVGSVNYTVDWGDGTIETYSSSTYSLSHYYDFSTISSPLTTEGWKQVIVQIYPTNPIDTFPGYVFVDQSTWNVNNWLDIKMASTTCNSFTISTKKTPYLKKFTWVGTHQPLAFVNGWIASSLEELDIDFTNITSTGSAFQSVGGRIFNEDDYDLTCASTAMTSTFSSCNLQTLGNLTLTAGATSLLQTFYLSTRLERVGNISAPTATTMNTIFSGCVNLQKVGTINISGATSATNAFSSCVALKEVGDITTTSVFASISGMFANCYSLQKVKLTNCSGLTSAGTAFTNCYSLFSLSLSGIKVSFSVASTALNRTALVALFNDLGIPVTTQIITVTGTPGSPNLTAADILIATSKNWTVTL
jgi:hypothetical protein